MPPISHQRGALSYENPSLSDQDVGFLYQIISRAESHPEVERLPFRALFEAYDEVLAEHGAEADHGQVCLRFLFKMGSKGVRGKTLFDKFENLLGQMGIVLELDDGTTTHDVSQSFDPNHQDTTTDAGGHWEPPRGDDTTQRTRRRRASFNSMYDVGEDATQRSFANRPSSRNSLSRLQVGKPEFEGFKLSPPRRARNAQRPESPDRTQLLAQFLEVGRQLMSRMGSSGEKRRKSAEASPLPNGHPAKADFERIRSDRIAAASSPQVALARSIAGSSDDDDDEKSSASEGPEANDNVPFEKDRIPPEMLYRPSLSDMLRDASTFNMYRQRAINRRILTQWLKKAVQAQQARRNMEIVAVNRDRHTLLRQGFEMWHAVILEKRQAARTERFFKHLEARAARARDLYLMTKAFTHWAQVTADEVARTSAARRHILGVKYFNAWREITAVNELKAQRFGLRRPFHIWRKRLGQIRTAEANAVVKYDKKLMHDAYWGWFWHLCDLRAPRWYDYCIKKRSLISWLRNFRTNREREHEMAVRDKCYLLDSGLQALFQKFKAVTSADQEATHMHRQHLLRKNLDELRIQSRLAPVATLVSDMVDERIVRTAFRQWVLRAQMLKQAREIDRGRIVRNAWTTWNDLLRCNALSKRIEERLKMETMYKWVLAERCRLMQRVLDQRITREVFSKFVANIRGTYGRLLYNADIHRDHQRQGLLRSKFACWRDKLARQQEREYIASEFYIPVLKVDTLGVWRTKHQQVKTMEGWAERAYFYFLMMRITKRWHVATVESSKRRRQDAYAKVRRKAKINMASKALMVWQSKTRHVMDMEQQAVGLYRDKTLEITSELFDRWQGETAKRVQDCRAADIYYARHVGHEMLTRFAEVLVQNHERTEQANRFYRLHVLGQAAASLRKLSLRVFQIKSTLETADSMRERNRRKHSRTMFRHWVEKTRLQLEARDSPGPTLTPARGLGIADNTDGASRSIFDPWYPIETPFKSSDLLNSSQAPQPSPLPQASPLATPSYMTSPSKRETRAKVLARISTTPATPLYTPFASRLLRAGAGTGNSAPNLRGRSGRGSAMGASVRFAGVEPESPESPTDGRKSANRRT